MIQQQQLPGYIQAFIPALFTMAPGLFTPFAFTDITKSRYGQASLWRWDFGDETTAADTSHLETPEWLYHSLGPKTVTLTVSSDKGCTATVPVQLEVT